MRPEGILQTLESAGYEARYVGGCVRDTLLSRPIHDWDIATQALPEQVLALFPHAIATGAKHGTVTVIDGEERAEVTTYRLDGQYMDSRHPRQVQFVRTLADDLARRDFTINAMALSLRGELTDLYGGQEDLRRGVIRCVGVPEQRFTEDALRMLRAYRFAAQLGFSIEPRTQTALAHCAPLCARLSRERVRDEAEKTLCSPRPELFGQMLRLGLLAACCPAAEGDFSALRALPATPEARWTAAVLACPTLSPETFRLNAKLCRLIALTVRTWQPLRTRLQWKQLVAAHGWQTAVLQAQMQHVPLVTELLASGECVTLRQLAVSGKDFPALSGPQLGAVLRRLLGFVLEHPEQNTKPALLARAELLLQEIKNSG